MLGQQVVAQRLEEDADQDREGGGLGSDREVGGDGRGRAGVGVGHPHLERRDGGLEAEAGDQEDSGQQQRGLVAAALLGNVGRNLGKVGAAREAEQQRHPVKQHGGGDCAGDEVLEAGLAAPAVLVETDEDVLRDRGEFERDEDRDQVARAREQLQAGGAEQNQGEVLAAARGDAAQRLAREQHGGDGRAGEQELEEGREAVEDERPAEAGVAEVAGGEQGRRIDHGGEDGNDAERGEGGLAAGQEIGDEQQQAAAEQDDLRAEQVDVRAHHRPPAAETIASTLPAIGLTPCVSKSITTAG